MSSVDPVQLDSPYQLLRVDVCCCALLREFVPRQVIINMGKLKSDKKAPFEDDNKKKEHQFV